MALVQLRSLPTPQDNQSIHGIGRRSRQFLRLVGDFAAGAFSGNLALVVQVLTHDQHG